MRIKGIVEEDFVNYQKPSMVIMFPICTFKCDHDCGKQVCQNGALATAPTIDIPSIKIVRRYLDNPITKSIVMAGLEPFDSYADMVSLISGFRGLSVTDPVVIYTGYREDEIPQNRLRELSEYGNIIVKFGRYIPSQEPHYDEVLGVMLASDNQYAKKLENKS